MPDLEGSDPPSRSVPGPTKQGTFPRAALPELDLEAALGGLDRATKDFTRRLAEAESIAARAAASLPRLPAEREPAEPAPASSEATLPPSPTAPRLPSADEAYEARLREAEREARLYLERARQRADSLVATMVAAVEEEAAAIRRDAEDGMRTRREEVEADARHHLEEAVRVGNGIVAERQQRLAVLSDGITSKAEVLSSGLEDADRIRIQFDAFVRALAVTADRIARQAPAQSGQRILAEFGDSRDPRPSAIAA